MLRWLLWCLLLPLSLPLALARGLLVRWRPCTALQLQLRGALPDVRPGGRAGTSLLRLARALELAAHDPQLRVVNVHLDHPNLGLGQAEELRVLLHTLKASGKQVVVSAETLGLAGYWVALGASRVVLCPTGSLDVTGVASEFTLLRGLLDRVGLRARMVSKGRFKSMREMFTEHEISAANREMLNSIVGELYAQLIARVAEARGLQPEVVKSQIDEGPFRASEALRLGLIDSLQYQDELDTAVREDKSVRSLSVDAYLRRKERRFLPLRPPLVAVLEVKGTISTGKDGAGLGARRSTGSESFIAQVQKAKDNPRVKALLLRVNSPGGSALASDLMWRALCLAQQKKPIVVSMGDIAASGGYYVSGIPAAKVLANPTTLTGSIGVVAGKWEAEGLLGKLGVRREFVHAGRNAGYYSPTVTWGPEQEAKLVADVDALYDDFVGKMAAARALPVETFEPLARGRVWTGSQALQHRLVDDAGGLSEAMVHLRQVLGLAAGARLGFVSLGPSATWRRLLERFATSTSGGGVVSDSAAQFESETRALDGSVELARLRLPFDIRFR